MNEKSLENIIERSLIDKGGFQKGAPSDFDAEYCMDTTRVKEFLRATQPDKVEQCGCFRSASEERKFFSRMSDQIAKLGVTTILRKGFKYLTYVFDMYEVLPSEINPTAKRLYELNSFSVMRQVHFSKQQPDLSVDVVLLVNGLPVVTMELKNHYTGQTVANAVKQYQKDRDPREKLFAPKRCAVHFAVDDDEVMMCSELKGDASFFLPFNKGCDGGAGNPLSPSGLRTAYLWEEVLEKKSLSNILEHYAQVVVEENVKDGSKKEKVIWPRYHQLEVVRALLADTKEKGVGHRYLIMHSAGSGKSNSITWLAYQLVGLMDGTTPLLDSVIVVTDRLNLDKQIRNNILAFSSLKNIVAWASSSSELDQALKDGKKIIITIVHKFPFILDTIGASMKDHRFGIIIDEAHSSQNGSMSAKMNMALGGVNSEEEDDSLEDKVTAIIEGRKMVQNANYYAFTATPKNKTLEMFGEPFTKEDGEIGHRPFHTYTMKQAIEEGFILDVLKNYTPYSSYYKLIKAVEDDPKFDKVKASRKLRAYVESQPETIGAKARIIVTHFQEQVYNKGKVGGQARAMVVTSSIQRAIDFYMEISKLLKEMDAPYQAMVAFSGEKEYGGKVFDEAKLNGFPSAQIEEKFKKDPYRILIVANKFQTGYDEPLLHTMYVDKMLSDVKAVQTLSRLNRVHPKKNDTFVLDFANDPEDIQKAFQKYYKSTSLSHETDPNKINDLLQNIEDGNFYEQEDIDTFVDGYLRGDDRETLDPIINKVRDRYVAELDLDTQVKCKKAMKRFLSTYAFLAAIIHVSPEWEKDYIFFSFLVHKLPKLSDDELDGLIEAVEIDWDKYRINKGEERKIQLENEDRELDPIPLGGAKGAAINVEDLLSNIIDEFNDMFGGVIWAYPEEAKRQVLGLPEALLNNPAFVNAARNNDESAARIECGSALMDIIVDRMEKSTEFANNFLSNSQFQNFVTERVFGAVYEALRKAMNFPFEKERFIKAFADKVAAEFEEMTGMRRPTEGAAVLVDVLQAKTIDQFDGYNDILIDTFNRVCCQPELSMLDKRKFFTTITTKYELYLKKLYWLIYGREIPTREGIDATPTLSNGIFAFDCLRGLKYSHDTRYQKFYNFLDSLKAWRNDESHIAQTATEDDLHAATHIVLTMYMFVTLASITDLESSGFLH